ncbi:MAG: hypothetical protein C4589_12095 [Peptococcaceae bacterium]|nr:MAG: hypothetical protein C4589_12095 [Peptococcaceae bacterium]
MAGVLVGTAGLPLVRRSLRGLAVSAVKGALVLGDGAKELSRKVNNSWAELVEEVKREQTDEEGGVQQKARRAEVELIKKGIDVADQVKGNIGRVKGKVSSLIEEAKKDLGSAGGADHKNTDIKTGKEKPDKNFQGNSSGNEEGI